MKYCSKCGNELLDEAVICPKCGCPTESTGKPRKKKGKGFKIILIVFGVLMVLYVIGSLFGGNTSDAPNDNANDEAAYACTQDTIEHLMKLTSNPHSMKIYTVKYDLAGKDPAEMVLCLYIEYKFVNSDGNGTEEHGFVSYNVDMEERTFAMLETCEFEFSQASLSSFLGGGRLSLNHKVCGAHYSDDTSGWTSLNIDTVKETAGLD